MKPTSSHWADLAAHRVVRELGDQQTYTCASGITPSGVIHLGNFREAVTVDFIQRALQKMGKTTRSIHSWDDFDTFRKIPVNFPKQEMLEGYLRQPICDVPDPFEKSSSYAEHNCKIFEAELAAVGIKPEFLYQHKKYRSGEYAQSIRTSLERRSEIAEILNVHRTSKLGDDWLPTSVYCSSCNKDEMEWQRYGGEWEYSYKCSSCGHEETADLREMKNIKLGWRVDWPMRWEFEKVDFEPGGKDHSSEGSSYDTGKVISTKIWDKKPPIYQQYDFVMMKGGSGKMSSSKGELLTLSLALEVYEPEIVRWIFANQRPNTDFSIAFDEDVIKVYDEFDRCEDQAFGSEPEKKADKWLKNKRTYELSLLTAEMPQTKPSRIGFRELTGRLQICDRDIERCHSKFYADQVQTEQDKKLFNLRCSKALAWLDKYAEESFKYSIRSSQWSRPEVDDAELKNKALAALRGIVCSDGFAAMAPKELNQKIYDDVVRGVEIDAKVFFQDVYQHLVGRDQGPRLPAFLLEIGAEKLKSLLPG
jgi:lysyl-tRNA synthetase class 1